MKCKHFVLFLLPIILFPAFTTQAQSSRLSQIDFDDGPPPLVDPQELLDRGMLQVQPTSPKSVSPHALSNLALAKTSRDISQRLNNHSVTAVSINGTENLFITPRLKGPFVDKSHNNMITTERGWRREGRAQCSKAELVETLCLKAGALKEFIARFSGSDELIAEQCQQDCQPGFLPLPTALNIRASAPGALNIVYEEKQCRYQAKQSPDGRWLAMQATNITCSCLPEGCLK
jgi:hypothetical protein